MRADFCGVWLDPLHGQVSGRLPAQAAEPSSSLAVVSRITPGAFQIGLSEGRLTIGAGRLYVDGLVAENRGTASGSGAMFAVEYGKQPHWPSPTPIPTTGQYLAYLDVWQCKSAETVWQVRLLPVPGDATWGSGLLAVPGDGSPVALEDGVTVTFGSGKGRAGDHRTFAAGAENLVSAPPDGTHHHYARLALVTASGSVTDCRPDWSTGDAREICVTPDQHNDGSFTIQDAIERARRRSGGTITLCRGTYRLDRPLELTRTRSIRIRGCGQASRLVGRRTAITIGLSHDIALQDFSVGGGAIALGQANRSVRLERLWISQPRQVGISLTGVQELLSIRGCLISAESGVVGRDLYAGGLTIEENTMVCTGRGIDLGLDPAEPASIHGNTITEVASRAGRVDGRIALRP